MHDVDQVIPATKKQDATPDPQNGHEQRHGVSPFMRATNITQCRPERFLAVPGLRLISEVGTLRFAHPTDWNRAMCNEYGNRIPYSRYVEEFSHIKLPLNFATAAPNLEPRDSIRLTDTAPIIRAAEAGARLDEVRWSWPDPKTRRLVFNMRSEGRKFSRRCLVPASCFYEFTAPEPGQAKGRKTKWRFTLAGADWFCIAGTWRPADEATPEAFSMLTCEPGPD